MPKLPIRTLNAYMGELRSRLCGGGGILHQRFSIAHWLFDGETALERAELMDERRAQHGHADAAFQIVMCELDSVGFNPRAGFSEDNMATALTRAEAKMSDDQRSVFGAVKAEVESVIRSLNAEVAAGQGRRKA